MVGRKRKSTAAAEASLAALEAPASRRRSQRVSSTAQKSKYFEPASDSEPERAESATKKAHVRGRPSKKAKVQHPESEAEDNEDDYNDEEQEADPETEESVDEDAPPKVTFIPLPKLRDTGGIEYTDDRLHPNTLAFLKDLKANNKRSWLKSHDAEYRRALKDWESYVGALTETITAADPTVPELPFKDVNFRIYRDIRFSKDPTPYKPHFSAAFSRTGRKGPYACYYIHIEPGSSSFIAGGLWHPDGPALAKLRASIDERPRRWRDVLNEPGFRRTFLEGESPFGKGTSNLKTKSVVEKRGKGGKETAGVGAGEEGEGDEEAAIRAFAERNSENALKTRPKGFHPEHRDMELLKLRNFTVGRKVPDGVFVKGEEGLAEVGRVVGAMVRFVTHLNRVVMPDPGDESDEEDEEEDEDEDEE